ncbi:MAG TPA: hypothetical protein VNA66_11450 [Gammaproteobacteria bacterium]|nr:hypothetical protein [Gammaproteobacteria bacterium]
MLTVCGALLAGGAAFGAVQFALSALSKQVSEHVKSDEKHQAVVIDRLARIETILTERK